MAINFEELKQLDPRDPGRWPLPVRLGVITLVFVVVAAALLYFVVWGGAKDELASLESQEQTLRDDFRTKHAKAVNLELYKQQLVDIEKSFGAMLRQLPGRTEMQNLLVDISQSGTATGLQQQLFKPLAEQKREFYAEKPIQIRLTGSYHQMGQFVSTIAQLPRIVTLHDVDIQVADKGAYDQLVMEVTAMTYRYLDDNEIATASAERKKQGAANDEKSLAVAGAGVRCRLFFKDSDLQNFIEQTKQEQPGGVEPLPEIKPWEPFLYSVEAMRSPFVPGISGDANAATVRPDSKRNKESLEAFSLDTLKMKGTMNIRGQYYGLVRDPQGLVHRVLPGNYLGQNEGRITKVEPSRITITEIVPDGLGGFMERGAGLALDE